MNRIIGARKLTRPIIIIKILTPVAAFKAHAFLRCMPSAVARCRAKMTNKTRI